MKDILIVEDGKAERERLVKLFGAAGYSCLACDSVAEAERRVQEERFRLVVLDIGLTDKSGSYLFTALKRAGRVSFVIVFTGNPSAHLKQRLLDEGASDYLVKGSPAAQNEAFLNRVKELLGPPQPQITEGIDLDDFLATYVVPSSRDLFREPDGTYPACGNCGTQRYVVHFASQPQVPPKVVGIVRCGQCGTTMDPKES